MAKKLFARLRAILQWMISDFAVKRYFLARSNGIYYLASRAGQNVRLITPVSIKISDMWLPIILSAMLLTAAGTYLATSGHYERDGCKYLSQN